MAVYFIRAGNYIKIGKADNPWKRLSDLQTANAGELEMLAIMPGGFETESEIHDTFRGSFIRGEWFAATPELLRFTKRVRDKHPEEQRSLKKSPAGAIKNQLKKITGGASPDDWRFEIKRKPRKAVRKNQGSTAQDGWYYWVVRVNLQTGQTVYYSTLDIFGGTP